MHRHLTPSRITLLILADLYLTTDEIPQTAQLAILKLMSRQIIQTSESDDIDIETRLKASTSDISYFADVLSKLPSVIPGRNVYDRLLTRIWALDGLDTLFVFFEQVKGLVVVTGPKTAPAAVNASTKAKVSRFSPLGQFIRRCSHEFERLQFPDVQKLYAALQAYRSSSYSIWSNLNPQKAATLPPITQIASASLDTGFASDQEITTLLSLSLHALQNCGVEVWRVYSGLPHVSSPSGVVQAANSRRKATGINRYPDPRYHRIVACGPGPVGILAMGERERGC